MTFDYNDFIFKNKNENLVTKLKINVKPSLQYHFNNTINIESLFSEYYIPSDNIYDYEYTVDSINVYITLYQYQCLISNKKQIAGSLTVTKAYGKCNNTFPSQRTYYTASMISTIDIANHALHLYQNIVKIKNVTDNMHWTFSKVNTTDNNVCDLKHIFEYYIPDMWMIFNMLYEYIGYTCFNVVKIKATTHGLAIYGRNSRRTPRYNRSWYRTCRYHYSRMFTEKSHDYIRQSLSFIPTCIYNEYINYYPLHYWNHITYFSKKKPQRRHRIKTKRGKNYKIQQYKDQISSATNRYDRKVRCPCGCKRLIKGKHKSVKYRIYKELKRCIFANEYSVVDTYNPFINFSSNSSVCSSAPKLFVQREFS
eukprot:275213_1